jgi:tetratricopeptide (TPR) repeat protein
MADHHISPGKKQWTWGSGDFGKAWDRSLTDEDGPYIELMAGVYTDNQPDFTWLQPYEEKSFVQRFLPYKAVGMVKSATPEAVAGLEAAGGKARAAVYAVSDLKGVSVRILGGGELLLEETVDIPAAEARVFEALAPGGENGLSLEVRRAGGGVVVEYSPKPEALEPMPDPAKAIGAPETLDSAESLYLAGLHLEQYRHATFLPEDYYLEGLKRDKRDIRLNNAYGNLMLRRGSLAKAEGLFRAAIKTLTRHNSNPYDGEAFYNLGKALLLQDRLDEAFDSFFKATWSEGQRPRGCLKLGQISALKGDCAKALDFAEQSLELGRRNFKARNLKAATLRKLGRAAEALAFLRETVSLDPMDLFARRELALAGEGDAETLESVLGDGPHNHIHLAESYAEIGLWADACAVLEPFAASGGAYPMIYYYLADYAGRMGIAADSLLKAARAADPAYCFPNSIRDRIVLEKAIAAGDDANALYFLGNLLYDKRGHEEAIACWEKSAALRPGFPTVHRNLALACANKRADHPRALGELEEAFRLDESDSRVFYELMELRRRMGAPEEEILQALERRMDLVDDRDDLSIMHVAALNYVGRHEDAIARLLGRRFHPWEGGEGKVPAQHVEARIGLAKRLISEGRSEEAIFHLEEAKVYKESFGEGKLAGARENNIDYWLGVACESLDPALAKEHYSRAAAGDYEPASAVYYNDQPPHMIYYQGLALRALGREDDARRKFNALVCHGEKHCFDKPAIDFFAVSLPEFLVFEPDMEAKSKAHCFYMMALGRLGLGEEEKAKERAEWVRKLDPNHYGIRSHFTI